MRFTLSLLFLLIYFSLISSGQKLTVDNNSIDNWTSLKDINPETPGYISPKGNYYAYAFTANDSQDSLIISRSDKNVIIRNTVTDFFKVDRVQFTLDEDYIGYIYKKDSFALYDAKKKINTMLMSNVDWFRFIEFNGSKFVILKSIKDSLISIYRDNSELVKTFNGINYCDILENDNSIIISSVDKVVKVQIQPYQEYVIYDGKNIGQICVNKINKDVYIYDDQNESSPLIYYNNRKKTCKDILLNHLDFSESLNVNPFDLYVIPSSGGFIFRMESKKSSEIANTNFEAKFSLWNYKMKSFEDVNEYQFSRTLFYMPDKDTVMEIFNQSQYPVDNLISMAENGVIVTCSKINQDEYFWNDQKLYLTSIDLKTGNKFRICELAKSISLPTISISSKGNYVVWWNCDTRQYTCYDVKSRKTKQFHINSADSLYDIDNDIPQRRVPFGIAGWDPEDEFVYLYSTYDIYKVPLNNVERSVCITNYEGNLKKTKLRFVKRNNKIESSENIILSAFNVVSKENGFLFYRPKIKFTINQQCLGPFCYRDNNSFSALGYEYLRYKPLKALLANKYLVRRESSTQSPNLFLTSDFITYLQLTNIAPEKRFNWYRSKLIQWEISSGKKEQGILYYPENLDSSLKYPVIFTYYEKRSDELFVYKTPKLSYGDLSIPWYTSHGFVVFVPNISYGTGEVKDAIRKTLLCSLDSLSKISWIDTSKVGLQGHSHGGFETYLASTSSRFKAAQVSAGFSDLATFYSYIFMEGTRQTFVQYGQTNIGYTPWESKKTFTNNSPLYNVDSINIPVFIMHPRKDDVVPVSHGMNMFTALRRLKKPTWLLIYEDEGHSLISNINQLDFTIKQQDYFSYFLKQTPQPAWLIN
ncbi:alpha/beta hydrolase family protein [Chitinophaga rhizophila]|uniref:Prolyl oligopeptidase family serine peptidase n=1 Tax=Chitinophaga rhizophila TaxID=2866212 RepID=A0ABS7G742_9BACT|nr:prolyl oligopeptidase family serine peptidase [Chitinophaga rhizophila]MBW8683471.1 prolyl oligopeptidase family serine peptidase [Chitinophaga rhizophila]